MADGMVTTITPRLLLLECTRRGIDPGKLLAETGMSLNSLQMSTHLPVEKMPVLWDRIIRLTGEEMFGLHAAEKVPFGEYRLLDYMMAAGSSALQALLLSCQSFSLVNNVFLLSLRWQRNLAYFELLNPGDPEYLPRPYIEYILTNYLVRLRSVTQTCFSPIEVHVTYRKPESIREYDRVFGAPVRFGQTANRMIFSRNSMEAPISSADPELFELLQTHMKRKLHNLSQDSTLLCNIRMILQEGLKDGTTGLVHVSRQLAMSCRGLQRAIFASGTTFRGILDDVRREQMLRLLDEIDLPIYEIAFRLGFGSVSSFTHACHRWTGLSPHSYRKHIHRGAA